MRQVYVAGTGSTRFGKHAQTSIEALAVDAGAQALVQSGIDRTRIGAVYLGNFISTGGLGGRAIGFDGHSLYQGRRRLCVGWYCHASRMLDGRHGVMRCRAGCGCGDDDPCKHH